MFQITNHRLAGAPFVVSPHVGGRIEPTLIVLHDTADRLHPDDTISWFKNPKSRVSAHFVVGRDGAVTQMVPCDRAAWHAGTSAWKGRKSCNGFSIGIEIDNPGKLTRRGDRAVAWFGDGWPVGECVEMSTAGHGHGWWLPYTDAQIAAVQELVRALVAAYPTIVDVAGHFEISPGRKVDCGPQFPLEDCRLLVAHRQPLSIGLVRKAQERLTELGYWLGTVDGAIGPRTRSAIRTFQEQNGLPILDGLGRADGGLDAATRAALFSANAKPMPSGTDPGKAIAAVTAQAGDATVVKRGTEATGLFELVNVVRSVGEHMQTVETAKSTGVRISDLITWAMTPQGLRALATLAVCVGIWTLAHRITKRAAPAPAPAA